MEGLIFGILRYFSYQICQNVAGMPELVLQKSRKTSCTFLLLVLPHLRRTKSFDAYAHKYTKQLFLLNKYKLLAFSESDTLPTAFIIN